MIDLQNDRTHCLRAAWLIEERDLTAEFLNVWTGNEFPLKLAQPEMPLFAQTFGKTNAFAGLNTMGLAVGIRDHFVAPVIKEFIAAKQEIVEQHLHQLLQQENKLTSGSKTYDEFMKQYSQACLQSAVSGTPIVSPQERSSLRRQVAAPLAADMQEGCIATLTNEIDRIASFNRFAWNGEGVSGALFDHAVVYSRFAAITQVIDAVAVMNALASNKDDAASERAAWCVCVSAGVEEKAFHPTRNYMGEDQFIKERERLILVGHLAS